MKVLFVCNQNQNRSKTAAVIFKGRFNTKSAGLYCNKPLTAKQLSWSNVVIVMEDEQGDEIAKRFPKEYMQKRILSLEIPDIYHFNEPKLVKVLKAKIDDYANLL